MPPTITTPKPGARRWSFVVAGPGGTGKSWLCGSMAKTGPTLLLATLSRETESWLYHDLQVPRILFEDRDWKPTLGSFKAAAFPELLRALDWLRDEDDTYDNIIIDSGTEMAELAWHLAMSMHGVATPAEMEDKRSRWLPYDQLDIYLDQAVKSAVALTKIAKRPKNVAFTWHVQPPKDDQVESVEGTKVRKESADNRGEGTEYEGKVLPMIRGRFRRRLINQVDAFVYTDMAFKPVESKSFSSSGQGLNVQYRIQVRPDPERHTKIPGPLPDVSYIPNEFSAFLGLLERSKSAAK